MKEAVPRPLAEPRPAGLSTAVMPAHDLCVTRSRTGYSAALLTIHSPSLGPIHALARQSAEGMEALLAGDDERVRRLLCRRRDELAGRLESKGLSCSVEVGGDAETVMATFRETTRGEGQESSKKECCAARLEGTLPVDIVRLS